jgi:hypothetical protein
MQSYLVAANSEAHLDPGEVYVQGFRYVNVASCRIANL